MEYYIVLLVFYAITLIFLRLVFAEIEGRQARKMSNVRYFLRYHSKFVYRNQFSIIFVAFLCYMIVSVEKAFSTMWFLQLLGFIAVGVISDALSQIVYYYYINFRFKKDIVESEELKNEKILILTDMFGGTPSNVIAANLKKYDFKCISGMNLPMLLDALLLRDDDSLEIEQLAEQCLKTGKEGIIDIKKMISEKK